MTIPHPSPTFPIWFHVCAGAAPLLSDFPSIGVFIGSDGGDHPFLPTLLPLPFVVAPCVT